MFNLKQFEKAMQKRKEGKTVAPAPAVAAMLAAMKAKSETLKPLTTQQKQIKAYLENNPDAQLHELAAMFCLQVPEAQAILNNHKSSGAQIAS